MHKPFAKLKRADFQGSPIWEWVLDSEDTPDQLGLDESCVQQTALVEVPLPQFGQYVVAAQIELKHGNAAPGVAEVTVADGQVVVQPVVVFLLDRQLQIPGVETNRLLARSAKTVENYPIGWRLAVRVQGETTVRTGQINGRDMKEVVRAGLEALLALKSLRQ